MKWTDILNLILKKTQYILKVFLSIFFNNSFTHKVRPDLHVASESKTLQPYHPLAFRSRLPLADCP